MGLNSTKPARDRRCHDELDLAYSALCTLVAVVVHYRVFGVPVSRPDVQEFLRRQEGFAAEGAQFAKLEKKGLVERRGGAQFTTWAPTARGTSKVFGWAQRAPEAAE